MSYIKREPEGKVISSYTCHVCFSPASFEALTTMGARCSRCYEVYCKDVQPAMKFPAGLIPQTHLAWAHKLKYRHEMGDRLSKIQIDMFKTALRLT